MPIQNSSDGTNHHSLGKKLEKSMQVMINKVGLEIGNYIEKEIVTGIETKSTGFENNWDMLKPETIIQKLRQGAKLGWLMKTGDLVNSIESRFFMPSNTEARVKIGVFDPDIRKYAKFHLEGVKEKTIKRKTRKNKRPKEYVLKVPKRDFISPVAAKTNKSAIKIAKKHLDDLKIR